jgi:hypothetical protein
MAIWVYCLTVLEAKVQNWGASRTMLPLKAWRKDGFHASPSLGLFFSLRPTLTPVFRWYSPCVHVWLCAQIAPLCEGTSHIGLGLTFIISCWFFAETLLPNVCLRIWRRHTSTRNYCYFLPPFNFATHIGGQQHSIHLFTQLTFIQFTFECTCQAMYY